ncbi:MAG: hypothetical protein V2A67_02965 [Bacteroidota bacterium]
MNIPSFLRICALTVIVIIAGAAWESCNKEEEGNVPTEEEQYTELLNLITSDSITQSFSAEGYQLEGTFIENPDASYPADQTVYDAGAIWIRSSGNDYQCIVVIINKFSSQGEAVTALNGESGLTDSVPSSIGNLAQQGTVDYKSNRIINALEFVRNSYYVVIGACSCDTFSPATPFTTLYSMAHRLDSSLTTSAQLKYDNIKHPASYKPKRFQETANFGNVKSILKQRMFQLVLYKGSEEIGYADVRFKASMNYYDECPPSSYCFINSQQVTCHKIDLIGELVRFHLNKGASDGDLVAGDGDILLRGSTSFTFDCGGQYELQETIQIDQEIGDITEDETLAGDNTNTAEPTEGLWPVVFLNYSGCQCPSVEYILLNSLSLYFHDNDSGGALDMISEIVAIFMKYQNQYKIIKFSNPTQLKINLIYFTLRLIAKYIVVPVWDDINFVGSAVRTFTADDQKVSWLP